MMTPEDLRSIVAKTADLGFVRYYPHWNYPDEPARMAIGVLAHPYSEQLDKDFAAQGFAKEEDGVFSVWSIERTD